MIRTSLCALLALSLSLSAPASAWAAPLGRGVKVVVAPVSGSAGAAGAAQTALSLPIGQTLTLTTLPGTPNLSLPSVSIPAPSQIPSAQTAAIVPEKNTAASMRGSLPSRPQATPIPGAAKTSRAVVPRFGAQTQGREANRVRFDGRVPARGVYGEGQGFKDLEIRVMQWVGKHWEAPVEELLSKNDVLLFGEAHSSLSSVDQIADNAGRLKAAGVRVIGIEGLKTPDQAAVNAYLAGETETVPDVFPSRKPAFARLLKAARREGVRVAALGRPLAAVAQEIARAAAERTGDPAASFGGDLIGQVDRADLGYEPGFNEAVAQGVLSGRNEYMAERLAGSLAPGEKAVALVGGAHVEHPENYEFRLFGLDLADYGSLAQSLRARALSAFSLTLTGGAFERPEAAGEHRTLFAPLYRLVGEAVSAAKAFLPNSDTTGILHLGGHASASGREVSGRGSLEPLPVRH